MKNYALELTDQQVESFVKQLFGGYHELLIHRVANKVFTTVRYEYGLGERGIVLRDFNVNVIGNDCPSYSNLYQAYMISIFGDVYERDFKELTRQAKCSAI